ncbi:acyl-CoA dehydrogenase family protein [Streptomyces sp. SID8352]|uniref:acyl-CoA dehydrogenase family protein n=1 Tax=Streptomyces sp. SID8352 TaxID=2690338 RepID=UPI00136D228E|nr:acyl-CoA dehydrogenase family protein [Streptomyces sp. SID8352]MYU21139.1 acyl-CoA dehydrogenase [Streptomyces sp. SID8352]
MDFALTEEQRLLAQTVETFATRELNQDLTERDAAGTFPAQAWRKCAGIGLTGLTVPEEYGGAGADAVTTMAAMEALGYGCRDNGLIFSLNAHLWAGTMPIVRYGTEQQRQHYLPQCCDGSLILAHAATEPGAGSDALSLTTTATRKGEGWLLNGSKTFVTNAPVAGALVVFAATDPAAKFAGLSAFLVDANTPGLRVGRPIGTMGLRTAPIAEVFFEDCPVSPEGLLGAPGAGMALFNSTMQTERALILASAVGTLRRNLERCIDHARARRQYGRPIGAFQAVAHRLVEMKLRLETARLLLYRLGWLLDHGQPAELDVCLVKLHISEAFVQSGLDAITIHGGYGYTAEYEVERDLRDAIGSRLYSGTSDIQRNIAASLLGL